jgi:D-glycero-alpha-D-manno-heptose-7-phosphate kinase
MIISKTPIRISFVGGGTDISNFYRQYGGEVISTAIDKYISVHIAKQTNSQITINTPDHRETVSDSADIQHPLIREAIRKTFPPASGGVKGDGLSITVTSDVPSRGCGLGSSSALTVGLLNALYAYQGIEMSPESLAHQACEIEIERLNQPIGKQDQHIAAYGGLRRIQFNRNESVHTQALPVTSETVARLEENFTLFYTGIQRRAETILNKQKRSASSQTLLQIKEFVPAFYDVLVKGNREDCLCEVGHLLDRGWQLKRSLCDSISNPMLDRIYKCAVAAGALGGKILGAGGGGYFLFYVPKAKQGAVTAALSDLGLSRLAFRFEQKGSQVIVSGSIEPFIKRQPPQVVDRNPLIGVNSLR